ncbi:hypothetical protein [Halomonas colorata]|uniref:Alpha/beta hydrolase n=1 Tax=Halomonas colorata TaxID=2742615 RepID=A0ABR9G0G9_9GAMM|nr:hypothetical protein [Halomonas colorata]MBE0464404.1 hypothetical protein [Halomonas colorata]
MFNSYAENGFGFIGSIYVKYNIINKDSPVIFTFANGGSLVDLNQELGSDQPSPWGYEFLKGLGHNVVSFSCVKGCYNYYRDRDFYSQLLKLREYFSCFPERLGYGASMGGYGVSAYANVLGIDRVLLMNPISTRSIDINRWDYEAGRSLSTYEFDWDGPCNDGAVMSARGYVVYDPLYALDKQHADRYNTLRKLKITGLGHGIPQYLNEIGVLKKLVTDFLADCVNEYWFYQSSRKRRNILRYYDWLLSYENKHLTYRRELVVRHYRKIFIDNLPVPSPVLNKSQVNVMRDAALLLESIDKSMALQLFRIVKLYRPKSRGVKNKIKLLARSIDR